MDLSGYAKPVVEEHLSERDWVNKSTPSPSGTPCAQLPPPGHDHGATNASTAWMVQAVSSWELLVLVDEHCVITHGERAPAEGSPRDMRATLGGLDLPPE